MEEPLEKPWLKEGAKVEAYSVYLNPVLECVAKLSSLSIG